MRENLSGDFIDLGNDRVFSVFNLLRDGRPCTVRLFVSKRDGMLRGHGPDRFTFQRFRRAFYAHAYPVCQLRIGSVGSVILRDETVFVRIVFPYEDLINCKNIVFKGSRRKIFIHMDRRCFSAEISIRRDPVDRRGEYGTGRILTVNQRRVTGIRYIFIAIKQLILCGFRIIRYRLIICNRPVAPIQPFIIIVRIGYGSGAISLFDDYSRSRCVYSADVCMIQIPAAEEPFFTVERRSDPFVRIIF